MGTQSRGQLAHFIAKTETSTTWHRLAKGIEQLASAMNPQTSEKTWIDDSSETTTTGFRPSWSISGDSYSGDPASEMLQAMSWARAKNEDAEFYMITSKLWEPGATSGSFVAYRQKCSWAPDSDGGGSGGETVTFSGNINGIDDPTYGEFDPDSGVFTPDP